MTDRITQFLDRRNKPDLKGIIKRSGLEKTRSMLLNDGNPSLYQDRFRLYLWKDALTATGRAVPAPDDNISFWDYTMKVINSKVSPIHLHFGESVQEGDLVYVMGNVQDETELDGLFEFMGDERRKIDPSAGRLGLVRHISSEDRWFSTRRQYSVLVNQEFQVARLVKEDLVKATTEQSQGLEIRVGDTVRLNNATVSYYVSPKDEEEGDDAEDFKGNRVRPRPKPKTEPVQRKLEGVEVGKKYLVLGRDKKNVHLLAGDNLVEVPTANVAKFGVAHLDELTEEEFQKRIAGVAFDFYDRKGIIRKIAGIRQLCIQTYRAGQNNRIKAKVEELGFRYDDFTRCCEVLDYVNGKR